MTVHTTIAFKREGHTLATEACVFRGRWLADAERKAMRWAEGHRLFRCATSVRILCEPPDGKTTSLSWLLCHTPLSLPEKNQEICLTAA
jgi:hypothetical protein